MHDLKVLTFDGIYTFLTIDGTIQNTIVWRSTFEISSDLKPIFDETNV